MFIMNSNSSVLGGIAGLLSDRKLSAAPDRPSSARYAMNHGVAWRGPSNSSAPIGATSAHRETPLAFAKPPRLTCSANGRTTTMANWLNRKSLNRRVRTKKIRLSADATW
jgi:hypothetical protein